MAMFNTLRATRTLTEAGIERAHAEAIVSTSADEFVTDRIATKDDIQRLELKTETDMRDLEQRLTIRMGAVAATATGLILAAIGVATGVLATL